MKSKPKVSRQQIIRDLKTLSDSGRLLNSHITKLIDECDCDYQEVFTILQDQLKFMRKAERDEFGNRERKSNA